MPTVRATLVGALLLLVTGAPAASATPPGASGQIAFRRYIGPDRTQGAIFVAAPDGTGERRLTTAPARSSDDFPDVAADGSVVAFQRCREACNIYTVRTDGTGLRRVGDGCRGRRAPPACPDHSYPAISPDGRQIAFVRTTGRLRDDRFDRVGIYAMNVDGSGLRRVSLPARGTAEDIEPQWSPDGRQIVFVRRNISARPRGQAVHVVNADGSGLRRLTPYRLRAGDGPDWAPDGTHILFRSPDTANFLRSNIWTIRADGTGLRQVTHAGPRTRVYSASFSPDGTAITLGMSGVNGQADVWRIGVDGAGLAPVTRTPQWDSAPDWGPAVG